MSEVITASPNEAESIRLEEFRRSRLQRLLQVRDAERQRSKAIRSNAEEQVALAKGDLKAKVTREVAMEFRQAMQHTRQRLRSAETSVGESFAAAQQHQEVLAVEARADYEALSRSVHVAAQRHQAAVQVEAAISSLSPSAVTRERAQRMANVRQEAAQESVSWASSRPPVQPKFNEMPKPTATRRHKPADASAFHTSHHHFGSGLLYPHSGPNVQVLRHPRRCADAPGAPNITSDESTFSAAAPAPVSSDNTAPDVGRRALAHQSSLAQSFHSAGDNGSFSRLWPQPRGISPSQAEDDAPNPLPAPQPRAAPAASADSVHTATVSSGAAQQRVVSLDASHQHEQRHVPVPQPIHYAAGQFVPSTESSFASHAVSSAPAAPSALPLKLVTGDGRLTMSATEIAQRIAELHRVRAIQEEAKVLKQEASIMNRGRQAAAYLRDQSAAQSASAAVEQVIKHAEQTRRQAARAIAPPSWTSAASGTVPENVREKAFERLLFQPAASKYSASASASSRIGDSDLKSCLRASENATTASVPVAQPLPSSLSLRGAILRDSSVATTSGNAAIAHEHRGLVDHRASSPAPSPSKRAAVRDIQPTTLDSDSSSDSLEQLHQPRNLDSSSDSDNLWPPQRSRQPTRASFAAKCARSSRSSNVKSSAEGSGSNADDVLMSHSSSASTSSSSPVSPSRNSNFSLTTSLKSHALASPPFHLQDHHRIVSTQHQEPPSHQAHSFQTASYVQRSSAVIDDKSLWQSSSPTSARHQAHSDTDRVSTDALLSPRSGLSKRADAVAPLRSSAPASFASTASDIQPERSTAAISPTRVPVSPARARVRILIPTAPLSPEPAAVIRSPPASNVSTPSDLQSPSLLQNVNILRDLRGSPVKGGAFHPHNSSFGEAASLAAMDDYSARGSIDDKLHARLSTDTWMRLSAARSSVASLELGNHEQNLGNASASPTQTRSEIHLSSDSSSEEDVHECISHAGKWLLFILFIVISQNLAQPFLQENLQLLQCSAPSSASATMVMMALTTLENLNRFPV